MCSVANLCLTLQPHGLGSLEGCSPWNFPGENTGGGQNTRWEWLCLPEGWLGVMQAEEEPRFPEKGRSWLQLRTYLLLQLPGLLSPEQHLVPGLLVGVGHQRVSVVGPQLWEEQLSGRPGQATEAGPGGAGVALGMWSRGGWGGAGAGASSAVSEVGQAGSSPSPAAWSSASCSSGFCGSPLPCPWTVLAGCARPAGTWGGCSWDNGAQMRKFLGLWGLGRARRVPWG